MLHVFSSAKIMHARLGEVMGCRIPPLLQWSKYWWKTRVWNITWATPRLALYIKRWDRVMIPFSVTGAQLGTVFSMPISGILCKSNFLGGWPSVFYVFGKSESTLHLNDTEKFHKHVLMSLMMIKWVFLLCKITKSLI